MPAKFAGFVRCTVRALAGGVVHEIFHWARALRSTGGHWQAAHAAPTHQTAPRWPSQVSGLEPSTTHLMEVIATNKVGGARPSEAAEIITALDDSEERELPPR